MKHIPSVYIEIVVSFLAVMLMLCVIVSDVNINHAAEFHADALSEIENSNFSQEVINSLEKSAEENNYELTVDCIADQNGVVTMAVVELRYKYAIPILNIVIDHKKTGIAR